MKIEQSFYLEIEGDKTFEDLLSIKLIQVNMNFSVDELTFIVRKKPIYFERYHLKEQVDIGRDNSCDIVYKHRTISKKHARIFFQEEWFIEDLDSRNGVYLNSQRVKKSPLKMGDCISISGFDLYFCDLFLCSVVPERTSLSKFVYQPTKIPFDIPKEVLLLDSKEKPQLHLPERKDIHFSIFRDVLMPLIYPIVIYGQTQNVSPFLLVSVIVVVARIIEKMFSYLYDILKTIFLKYRYKKQMNLYQRYLEQCFPTCDQLQKRWVLPNSSCLKVRLGKNQNGLIIHDFDRYPKLAIVGKRSKRIALLVNIIYQLERHQLQLGLDMKEVLFPFYLCHSRLYPKELLFSINTHQGHYRIDDGDDLIQLKEQYDALIHVDEGWYYTDHQIDFNLDQTTNLFLLGQNYHEFETEKYIDTSFLNLCGLNQQSIKEIRRQTQSIKGLLGWNGTKPVYLDLNETKDGPHILVAGMSGSGKSEWLTSYLLSLAIFYDTWDVQFLIIDFKGGALSHLFEKLYHTCQCLSNLDEYQIHRTIAALQIEVVQREQQLLALSKLMKEPVLDIDQLNQKVENKKQKIPHLLIVVDEFAELKMMYPEMMQSLVRIARTGRSLGIHLILCTQRPNGIVDRQIESNIQTRICMKVASKQDSYDVLGNDMASMLHQPGQWICMNGSNVMKGETAWVDEKRKTLILYDLNLNEVKAIFKPNPMKMRLIEKINQESHPTCLLYPKSLQETSIPKGYFGIYDDYQKRKVETFSLLKPTLLIGGNLQNEHDDVEYVHSYLEVTSKRLETMRMVIFFDEKAIEQLLFKKIPFSINKEEGIGALYYQRRLYQCKIRSCVT